MAKEKTRNGGWFEGAAERIFSPYIPGPLVFGGSETQKKTGVGFLN